MEMRCDEDKEVHKLISDHISLITLPKFDEMLVQERDEKEVNVEKVTGITINHSSWVREELEMLLEIPFDWLSLNLRKDVDILPIPDLNNFNSIPDIFNFSIGQLH